MYTIFDLSREDYLDRFATAGIRGTFVEAPPCPKCKGGRRKRVAPLVIEWEPGSDVVGDFTWPRGLEQLVVTQRVRDCLEPKGFSGFSFGPVSMVQDPKLRMPVRLNSRTKKRIWLPYSGPPLYDLGVTSWCHLDLEKSGRSLLDECTACHRQQFSIISGDMPLVIDPNTWDGSDFFRIREIGGVVFVVGSVQKVFEAMQFSNVKVERRGRIPNQDAGGSSRKSRV
jgi:hypothetical protein